jgi:hypothetical protein
MCGKSEDVQMPVIEGERCGDYLQGVARIDNFHRMSGTETSVIHLPQTRITLPDS